MAQFTAQGRLKLLFHGGVEPKDPFHNKLKTPLFFSSLKKGNTFNAKASLDVSDEGIYDDKDYDSELVVDDLACFIGLVLDISYRPINVVCRKNDICLEFVEMKVRAKPMIALNSPANLLFFSSIFNLPAIIATIMQLLLLLGRLHAGIMGGRKLAGGSSRADCMHVGSRCMQRGKAHGLP
ncbi:uncharacterized protein LOC120213978 [Hibiscus syriacus]|uniref:uncharacterized protein LOC120213978 n=1 Tax=Hibiscus syriacus TaxID=106335 RepID=UPI0019214FBD|nr:uncharacterized protein LOC120213978 [Hibiscus syriacus]